MRAMAWAIPAVVFLAVVLSGARAADNPAPARQPIVAGNLSLHPGYILAVYRPVEHQAVLVLVGRPGQAVHSIVITDVREAATVFDAIWNNQRITKNPGEADARPLTRMMLKDAEAATPALVVNVERVLAVRWDPNRRVANVYLDLPATAAPLQDPNTGQESDRLAISSNRREGEAVAEAYKAVLLTGGR